MGFRIGELRSALLFLTILIPYTVSHPLSSSSEEGDDGCQQLTPPFSMGRDINDNFSVEKLNAALGVLQNRTASMVASPQEAILVFGNRDARKGSLLQTVVGDVTRLYVAKTVGGDLVIVEKDQDILSRADSVLTMYGFSPGTEEPTTYIYESPDLDGSLSPVEDVAAAIFLEQAVKTKKRLKVLYTVSYSNLQVGNNRRNFDRLVQHAVKFLKNVTTVKQSVGLVVTNVNSFSPIEESLIWGNVVEFLHVYLMSLQEKQISEQTTTEKREALSRKIQFITLFLERDRTTGVYSRIAITRSPRTCEPLKDDLDGVNQTRTKVVQLYRERLQYSPAEEFDPNFGHVPQTKSVVRIEEDLNQATVENMKDLFANFTVWLDDVKFRLNSDDITETRGEIRQCLGVIEQLTSRLSQVAPPFGEVVQTLQTVGYMSSPDMVERLEGQELFFKFFGRVMGRPPGDGSWENSILGVKQYMEDLEVWYTFCDNVQLGLSKYDFQKKKHQFPEDRMDLVVEPAFIVYSKDNERAIYSRFKSEGWRHKGHIRIFTNLVQWAMKPPRVVCDGDTVVITGNFVRFSEFLDSDNRFKGETCKGRGKTIRVLASHTVFVDQDMDGVGDELLMAVVAPNWEVVGSRIINLNGGSLLSRNTSDKIADGIEPGENGKHALRGKPGKVGGSFLGIANKFLHPANLTITANGGSGGDAKRGGNGVAGKDGREIGWYARWGEDDLGNSIRIWGFYGERGQDGGSGGCGGAGGKGGLPGDVLVYSDTENPEVVNIVRNEGPLGRPGKGGKGSPAGKGSPTRTCWQKTYLLVKYGPENCTDQWFSDGKPGTDGDTGSITVDFEKRNIPRWEDPRNIIDQYTNQFGDNPTRPVLEFLEWLSSFRETLTSEEEEEEIVD